jgi:D-serine dehydratase
MIQGKSIKEWQQEYPILSDIMETKQVFWLNPKYQNNKNKQQLDIGVEDIKETAARLKRFAPYIEKVFPETKEDNGIIESKLTKLNEFKPHLENILNTEIKGQLYLKRDDSLPIAGSIKARGGIYEVLKYAESLALEHGLITKYDDYKKFAEAEFKNLFKQYSLAVGSTGNLGLSIGITGATLGFKTTVHMSSDARAWKKKLLRNKGVIVKEYESDYSQAVKEGRKESKNEPKSYFIDDEKSQYLFLGYAVAALRLKKQFEKQDIKIDKKHPLFVYLPCGVGGGPGGICFGLKKVFGKHVHCFFAEPTHSPAMLLGMMTGLHNKITVQKFGIDNKTAADGLAVGKPSKFVGKIMENILAGIFTVQDEVLFTLLKTLYEEKKIKLEPSALAGFPGVSHVSKNYSNFNFLKDEKQKSDLKRSTHLIWATGGSMVPQDVFEGYIK